MKTVKLLMCLLVVSAIGFYSCNDSDPIENNTPSTQQSVALRTALNEFEQANEDGSRPAGRSAVNPFCFEFVYPLTLSYNNGTTVTVASFGGLLEIVLNETPNLYISGISFPFYVVYQGNVTEVNSELAFVSLLVQCGYNTLANDLEHSYCFDLVFPIEVSQNNQIYLVQNMEQLVAALASPNGAATIVFPIQANYNGQTMSIGNIYQLYDLINLCDDCACNLEYAPVCVQTTTGTQEFGNMCFAMCAGYTQNDLVPCNGNSPCSITGFTATTGTCDPVGGTYQVTLNFNYVNPSSDTFDVSINGTSYGTHPLTALPITFNVPQSMAAVPGSSWVVITGSNCVADTGFAIPTCNCICTTDYAPVCVQTNTGIATFSNACNAYCAGFTQNDFVTCPPANMNFEQALSTCFTIQYPVEIVHQNQVILANNNGTVLQYWFPNQSPIPNFGYPITVTFGNQTIGVGNQEQFLNLINTHCN
ncbi:hypothetical protein [Flavobacterium sp.]|uniref:hypothetical protein n=1 Tax=Flavobacterium sp. TaxID=239 RepID=UPI0039E71657